MQHPANSLPQITAPEITRSSKRKFLTNRWQHTFKYSAKFPLAPLFPILFAEQITKRVLPVLDLALESSDTSRVQLTNLKGRDNGQEILIDWPADSPNLDNELLKVCGVKYEGVSTAPSEVTTSSFWYSICTPFERFESQSTMIHRAMIETNFPALKDLPVGQIARTFPLQITHLRFSFQRYSPRSFSSMLGLAPAQVEYLAVEASGDQFALFINNESSAKNLETPVSNTDLWEAIFNLVKQLTGADIVTCFVGAAKLPVTS